MESTYCRLCAEPINPEGLLNLDCDEKKCNEIHVKLSSLSALYVDVLTRDNLPRTVCFVCYDSLNKAYEFVDKVKKGQDKLRLLTSIFSDDNSKFECSDEERAALDDFFSETHEVPVKEESLSDPMIQVKIEPKEETVDLSESTIQDSVNNIRFRPNQSNEHINIQEILDSTLCKAPFTSVEVAIYNGFEVTEKIGSWKELKWVCAVCSIEFTDADVLRSHTKVTHNKCAAFSCTYCKTYAKPDDFNSFIKHVKKHQKSLRNRCHYCDEVIETDSLKAHIKQHQKTSVCPNCGEIFPNDATLREHLSDYIAVKQKRKPRRKKGTPITIEDLTCEICKKVYKNPNSLRDHIKRHTTDRKRNYTCDRCGKTFYSKGTLTTHVMVHEQIRPHVCRICNKSFVFPNMLRRHVEMHSGVKPYSCEICGRCFRLQYQLNAHKIVHTDAMPYVCQYCNKAFRFKQILKNHERQHTGAKPYCCELCSMEFTNWSNYNKHMKRRHNMDTSKKKITPEGVFPINPETGQIIQIDVQGMEEWKTKVMIPAKRGKKKKDAIKEENIIL